MQGRSVPGGFPSAPQPLCSSALWGAVLPFPRAPFLPFGNETGVGIQHPASSIEHRVARSHFPNRVGDYSLPPQYLQCTASVAWPPAPQSGQAVVFRACCAALASSTVTMPVGTAMMP